MGIWCRKADTAGDSSLHEQKMICALFQFPTDTLPEISVTIAKVRRALSTWQYTFSHLFVLSCLVLSASPSLLLLGSTFGTNDRDQNSFASRALAGTNAREEASLCCLMRNSFSVYPERIWVLNEIFAESRWTMTFLQACPKNEIYCDSSCDMRRFPAESGSFRTNLRNLRSISRYLIRRNVFRVGGKRDHHRADKRSSQLMSKLVYYVRWEQEHTIIVSRLWYHRREWCKTANDGVAFSPQLIKEFVMERSIKTGRFEQRQRSIEWWTFLRNKSRIHIPHTHLVFLSAKSTRNSRIQCYATSAWHANRLCMETWSEAN